MGCPLSFFLEQITNNIFSVLSISFYSLSFCFDIHTFSSIYVFTFPDFLDSSSCPSLLFLSTFFFSCLLRLLFLVSGSSVSLIYYPFLFEIFIFWKPHLSYPWWKPSYFSTSLHSSLSPLPFLCLSLSGAVQSFSLYDQLQAGRALLLCDRADREHAVGSRSC